MSVVLLTASVSSQHLLREHDTEQTPSGLQAVNSNVPRWAQSRPAVSETAALLMFAAALQSLHGRLE